MRPIKYEVWDKRNRRMANSISKICWFLTGEIASVFYEVSEIETVTLYKGDFELREFTGLLDKNGKEIYEGDIILESYKIERIDKGEKQEKTNAVHRLVEWKKQESDYEQSYFHGYDILDGVDVKYENPYWTCVEMKYEVIGNIYSNPDLLSK